MTANAAVNRKIRVLVAKPGLDGHDVGAKLICRALVDAGMEVVYSGLRQSPQAIARSALQEGVDVVGLSVLSGAHLPLARKVLEELDTVGLSDLLVIIGGNIPAGDKPALEEIGIAGVFGTGTPFDAITSFLQDKVRR